MKNRILESAWMIRTYFIKKITKTSRKFNGDTGI